MGRNVILCLLTIINLGISVGLQCISESGSPVDWYVIYKLPEEPDSTEPLVHDGVGFYYFDKHHSSWSLSKLGINDTGHAVDLTLKQIYKNQTSDYMYVMYNDQPPNGHTSLTHGHTKGVFGFNKKQGFWLIMSIPKFPPLRADGFSFPESGKVYGQSILCVSLDNQSIEDLGNIMRYTYPKFYDVYFPSSFAEKYPTMKGVLAHRQDHVLVPPYQKETTLHTSGNQILHNFAKSTQFSADLYDAFLGPSLKENLNVESWQNGDKDIKLPSNCSIQYKIYNIQDVRFPSGRFTSTKDHSKWAVSQTGSWVCIGDINRQRTQFKRGGSTTCIASSDLWKQYYTIIRDIETCGPDFQFG